MPRMRKTVDSHEEHVVTSIEDSVASNEESAEGSGELASDAVVLGEGTGGGVGEASSTRSVSSEPPGKKKRIVTAEEYAARQWACGYEINDKVGNRVPCGKRFNRKSDMERHILIHECKRDFCCEVCSLTFIQSSALKVHMRKHTGEKPHSCEEDVCLSCFADSSSLARHRRGHWEKRHAIKYGRVKARGKGKGKATGTGTGKSRIRRVRKSQAASQTAIPPSQYLSNPTLGRDGDASSSANPYFDPSIHTTIAQDFSSSQMPGDFFSDATMGPFSSESQNLGPAQMPMDTMAYGLDIDPRFRGERTHFHQNNGDSSTFRPAFNGDNTIFSPNQASVSPYALDSLEVSEMDTRGIPNDPDSFFASSFNPPQPSPYAQDNTAWVETGQVQVPSGYHDYSPDFDSSAFGTYPQGHLALAELGGVPPRNAYDPRLVNINGLANADAHHNAGLTRMQPAPPLVPHGAQFGRREAPRYETRVNDNSIEIDPSTSLSIELQRGMHFEDVPQPSYEATPSSYAEQRPTPSEDVDFHLPF